MSMLPTLGQRASVTVIRTRVQGDRLPARVHSSETRPRHPAQRDQEFGHESDVCVLRAEPRLCCCQNPALGSQKVQSRVAAAQQQHEERRRGDEHRPHVRGDDSESYSGHRRSIFWVRKGEGLSLVSIVCLPYGLFL